MSHYFQEILSFAMTNRSPDIKLQDLLSAALSQCEQTLRASQDRTPNRSKQNFMISLLKCQIILVRLLVAFRFSKYPYMKMLNISRKKEMNNVANRSIFHLQNLYKKLQENKLIPLPSVEEQAEIEESIENPQNIANNDFTFLFINQIPQRLKQIRIIRNRAYFNCPNEYSFVIRKNRKNEFKLKSYTINWPKNITFPDITLKMISNLIKFYLETPNTALANIDRVLHLFYSTSELPLITKELGKLTNDFSFTLTRKYNKIICSFGEFYGFHGKFIFEMDHEILKMSSCAPIFVIFDISKKSFFPGKFIETPHTLASTDLVSCPPSMFNYGLPSGTHKFAEILIRHVRDSVVFTRLRNVWNPLMRYLTYIGGTHLIPKFDFDFNFCFKSKINVYSSVNFYLFGISIDAPTGQLHLDIFNNYIKLSKYAVWSNTREILDLLESLCVNFIFRSATRISQNVFVPTSEFHYPSINFVTSYSDYFYIKYVSTNGYPFMQILDTKGEVYNCPDLIKSHHLGTESSWKNLTNTTTNATNFIFILEVERILNEKGFKCIRSPYSVLFFADGFARCVISLCSQFCWKLSVKIHSPISPAFFDYKYCISGSVTDARSPHVAVESFLYLSKLLDIISHTSLGLPGGESDRELCIYESRLPNNSKFSVSPVEDLYLEGSSDKKVNWRLGNMFPSIQMHVLGGDQINFNFETIKALAKPAPSLAAFLSHTILMMQRVQKCLSSKWSFIYQSLTAFHLVYENIFTIPCEIRPANLVLLYCTPIPPASSVIVPLLSAKILEAANGRTNFRFRMTVDEFCRTIEKIAQYCTNVKAFIDAGLTPTRFVQTPIPRMQVDMNGVILDISLDNVNMSASDSTLNQYIPHCPISPAFCAILCQISSLVLQRTFITVIAAINALSKNGAETAIASATFRGSRVEINIAGFPFELFGTTARCGDMAFKCDDFNEVKAYLGNLF